MAEAKPLGGVERAAILLMSLGEQSAAAILRHLGPSEIHRLGAAMTGLRNVSRRQVDETVSAFLGSVSEETALGIESDDYVRRVLAGAVGAERATTLAEQIFASSGSRGIETLRFMSARAVADIVGGEHPQLIAVVLAHLDSKQGGEILTLLPPASRAEVVRRVAALSDLQQSVLAELDELVEKRAATGPENRPSRLSGLKKAADLLNKVEGGQEVEILDQLSSGDPDLGARIRDLMFVFDNLLELDDRSVQALLREVPGDQLIVALKGADPAVQEKLMRNMSQRAAEILKDDLEAKGPVRLSDVEAAQKEILGTMQRLAEEGKVMLRRGGEQFV